MRRHKTKPPVILIGTELIFVHDDAKGYLARILGPTGEPLAEVSLDRGNLHDIRHGISSVLRIRGT